jgi:N-acetyl sugar amidotransferase
LTRLCRRCLYPDNHPLGISLDAEGICSGCRVHEEKDRLDWSEREQMLARLLAPYRDRTRGRYDCVVPITGGRDSFFIVHVVRKVYGLNPLLVVYNRHYNSRAGIYNIARLRTVFGCDIVTLTLAPALVKRVMRATLAERGSFHWHAIAGQTVFPVQQAIRLKIPLVIWGAHQALEQVGMYSHVDEIEMTRRYRREHDLMGLEAEDLVGRGDLAEADLQPFFYPSDSALRRGGVRGIYLGNYIRWDSKTQHERMIELYDYYTGPLRRTFDTYNDIDDLHFTGAHDVIKFHKHGYGKVTDDACREIRFGRLTREQGIDVVRTHQHREVPNLAALSSFLDLSEPEIMASANRHAAAAPLAVRSSRCSGSEATVILGCDFRTNIPSDFDGAAQGGQLLTRGYARE